MPVRRRASPSPSALTSASSAPQPPCAAPGTGSGRNGERAPASPTVVVNPRTPLAVTIAATKGTAENGSVPYTFEATAPGAADVVQYPWVFGYGQTAATTSNKIQHFY